MNYGVRPHIRRVDPVAFAGEASALLKGAWQPPCLDYTPEYVRFQCGFPTVLDPIALAMFEGETPLGFIAATGRTSNAGDLYLSSFLSFRLGTDPMLPILLVRHESRTIEEAGRRALIFAEVGSAGEKLIRSRDSARTKRVSLGQYRVHAAVPQSTGSNMCVQEVSLEEWSVQAARLRDDSLLSPAFTSADLQHFCTDPHGRRFLVALDDDGKVIATAMQAFTSNVTPAGITQIPALHYVRLAEQRPDGLVALLAYAKHPCSPAVTVPNMIGISRSVSRAAGLRPTLAAFAAYLSYSDGDAPTFRGTDFEII